MNIITSGILSAILLTSIPFTTEYKAETTVIEEKTIWTEEELILLAKDYADYYNASSEKVIAIMKCEAPWKKNENGRYYDKNDGQSKLKYNEGQIRRNPSWGNVGDRERSFGIVQIHEPAHPSITREQALNPDFALDFLAYNVSKGKSGMWTCSGNK